MVHGTCVAFGPRAVLLRGPSGAGKSDLALRMMTFAGGVDDLPQLVADDQVLVQQEAAECAIATAPDPLRGKMEVRGLGIIDVPYRARAQLMLICDLVQQDDVPRMPPEEPDRVMLAGVSLPLIRLAAFEASAALKVKLAVAAAAQWPKPR